MTKRLIVAALTLPLVFASSAFAQGPTDEKSLNSSSPAALALAKASNDGATSPKYKLYTQQPGYQNGKDTVVQSWEVAKGASLDLGVFAIARYSNKQVNMRKLDPMKEVTGKSQHIPAVAFSFRF